MLEVPDVDWGCLLSFISACSCVVVNVIFVVCVGELFVECVCYLYIYLCVCIGDVN